MRARFTDSDMDWSEFLRRPAIAGQTSLSESAVAERSVLITGAGGSIGSGLAAAVLAGRPRRLVLLDLSEGALYESFRRLSAMAGAAEIELVPAVGGVGDGRLIAHLLQQHRPELIFHTAAYKHVPLMEQNPFSAIANNSMGTYRLVVAALGAGASRLIAVSTDKAVHPLSVMGVSKRIAELAVLSHSTSTAPMNVVRLCNVLGSSGSVAEVFQEQAERGLPLTVTHGDATRYFITSAEAERAILRAAVSSSSGRVVVPDCGEELRVLDLARYIAGRCGAGHDVAIEFTGLRPGDKLREELWSVDEVVEALLPSGMRVLKSPAPSAAELSSAIQRLASAVESFDRVELMGVIAALVPEYSSQLEASAETAGPSSLDSLRSLGMTKKALAQDDALIEGAVANEGVVAK
jgi:FlaA1/EpsC-like NDP-sugar epimerase